MDRVRSDPLSAQRNFILGLLLALAALAWAAFVWQSPFSDMDRAMGSPTMGLRPALFLALWVLMMVAMMFPTAAPMILAFHRVQASKRERGEVFVSTWVFVGAYLFVWTLAGIAAYAGALAAEAMAARAALSPATAARIGGAILIGAGLYQFSPLKDLCLSRCRTPITFIMTSWRDGAVGALGMGLLHGAYCLGCCWLLFVILFPLGVMNIAAMAAITAVIFVEKTMPWRRPVAAATAGALVIYGALVIAAPELLPTFPSAGGMAMPADMPMPAPPDPGSGAQQ